MLVPPDVERWERQVTLCSAACLLRVLGGIWRFVKGLREVSAYMQVAELEALQAVYPEAGAVEEDVPGLLLRVQQVCDMLRLVFHRAWCVNA